LAPFLLFDTKFQTVELSDALRLNLEEENEDHRYLDDQGVFAIKFRKSEGLKCEEAVHIFVSFDYKRQVA